ncbi:MAG: omptin family outer membrane protease [Gammaproteobacteria bacterium]|nr:omptin family outer membrane protease [Gammaproteobacteria bacterium]
MRIGKPSVVFTGLCSLIFFSNTARAFDVEAAYGQRDGEVAYQIGGSVTPSNGESYRIRFPISELRFPINTKVANIVLFLPLDDRWTLTVAVVETVSSNSGKMIDSDWGIKYYLADPNAMRDSLDIYSESQLQMNGRDFSLEAFKKVSFVGYEDWNIELGGGALQQKYDFTAGNTLEEYPSTPTASPIYIAGETIKYEYQSKMLYVAFKTTRHLSEKYHLSFYGAYSPKVIISDFDNHLLRDKTATGSSEGWGGQYKAAFIRSLSKNSEIFVQARYQKTVANGIQTQRSNETGVYTETDIGLRNINVQKSLSVGASIEF